MAGREGVGRARGGPGREGDRPVVNGRARGSRLGARGSAGRAGVGRAVGQRDMAEMVAWVRSEIDAMAPILEKSRSSSTEMLA